MPLLFELPTTLLEYLDLLQGSFSLPVPQGCYTYMIVITKMIEIYNIAAQPTYCIETIALHTPLKYFRLKRRRFVTRYVQPIMQQYKSTTVYKDLL